MSTFYGSVSGMSQTEATRRGSMQSGIRTSAQSYKGSLVVVMDYRDDVEKRENLRVRLEVADGSETSGTVIFHGLLDELIERLK